MREILEEHAASVRGRRRARPPMGPALTGSVGVYDAVTGELWRDRISSVDTLDFSTEEGTPSFQQLGAGRRRVVAHHLSDFFQQGRCFPFGPPR